MGDEGILPGEQEEASASQACRQSQETGGDSQPSSSVPDSQASVGSSYASSSPVKRKSSDKVSMAKKRKVVEFAFSTKDGKCRSINSINHQFGRNSTYTLKDITRWREQVKLHGDREEKLKRVREQTFVEFNIARSQGSPVHDIQLQRWALETAKTVHLENFKASVAWVQRFKKFYHICSRRVTNVVSKARLRNEEAIESSAIEFLVEVVDKQNEYEEDCIYNADQSGFQREVLSNRTLETRGSKIVEATVQSVHATTHSYTIMPMVSMSGRLVSPLLVVLPEKGGRVSDDVWDEMLKPSNLLITMTSSGKMGKNELSAFISKVVDPNVGPRSLALFDSWSSFKDNDLIQKNMSAGKHLEVMLIPEGTTSKIQPLDVFGFRFWKNWLKKFSDHVRIKQLDVNLQQRDSLLKIQSIIHNQFMATRYVPMWQYSWYKAGYKGDSRPEGRFDNPVDYCFKFPGIPECQCKKVAFIRCSHCTKFLCFYCFYGNDRNDESQYHFH